MTAVKTPATMEELAETWSMTSSANVKMGGKEKLATPVSFQNITGVPVKLLKLVALHLRKYWY